MGVGKTDEKIEAALGTLLSWLEALESITKTDISILFQEIKQRIRTLCPEELNAEITAKDHPMLMQYLSDMIRRLSNFVVYHLRKKAPQGNWKLDHPITSAGLEAVERAGMNAVHGAEDVAEDVLSDGTKAVHGAEYAAEDIWHDGTTVAHTLESDAKVGLHGLEHYLTDMGF